MGLNVWIYAMMAVLSILAIIGGWISDPKYRPPFITIVVVALVAGVALQVIKDQQDADERTKSTEQLEAKLSEILKFSQLPKETAEEGKRLTEVLQRLETNVQKQSTQRPSLKVRAARLSVEIYTFLERHPTSSWAPPFKMAQETDPQKRQEEFLREADETSRRFQALMGNFETAFGARVAAMRNELAEAGYTDPRLEKSYKWPVNFFGIRDIAQSIGALAEALPDA